MAIATVARLAPSNRSIIAQALRNGEREAVSQLSREKLGLVEATPILDAAKEDPDSDIAEAVREMNSLGVGGGG